MDNNIKMGDFIMANGIEKRRFKRMKADLSLNVSSLFKQDNMEIKNLDSPIKVINISEGGIILKIFKKQRKIRRSRYLCSDWSNSY